MMKVVFLVTRRAGMTTEDYQDYSTRIHAPLVTKLPGLERYVVNYSQPLPGADAPAYDGMVELWFESPDAFEKAMSSHDGQAAVADQANFLDPSKTVMLVVEEVELSS